MKISLISKNKHQFIDGSLLKPLPTNPLHAPWTRRNTMVLVLLFCSISKSIAKSVLWIQTAFGVWTNLRTRFAQSDVFRIFDIQQDVYRFRQGTLSVSDYFTQLKVFWDELESYRPILRCSCAIPCTCKVITSIHKHRDEDYVIRFLKGLNEKFSSSKSQIMMMTYLLDIDHAFSIVIQQERELNPLSSLNLPSDDTIALTATS